MSQDITTLLRAEVDKRSPARWIVTACTLLHRVAPQVWADCHSTVGTCTPQAIPETPPNLQALAKHDRPHVSEPGLRRSNFIYPVCPVAPVQGRTVWSRFVAVVNSCQPMLPIPWQMPRPRTLRELQYLLNRLAYCANYWEAQIGSRADDFRPVLTDVAHQLRRLVESDLAGWVIPLRVGETACTNAGLVSACKVSPVHARGLCRACYQRWYRNERNEQE